MPTEIYAHATPELNAARREFAPDCQDAFKAFSERVFSEGALSTKTKQLIADAAAHITQCPLWSARTQGQAGTNVYS